MHLELCNFINRNKLHVCRFLANLQLPADNRAGHTDIEFLSYLTIFVCEYVAWIRVDSHNPLNPHFKAGLFLHLTHNRLSEGLTYVQRPARQSPVTRIAAALEQDPTLIVHRDRGRPHH